MKEDEWWISLNVLVNDLQDKIDELRARVIKAEDLIDQFRDQGFILPAEYDDYMDKYHPNSK